MRPLWESDLKLLDPTIYDLEAITSRFRYMLNTQHHQHLSLLLSKIFLQKK